MIHIPLTIACAQVSLHRSIVGDEELQLNTAIKIKKRSKKDSL